MPRRLPKATPSKATPSKATPRKLSEAPAITPEDLAAWWAKNVPSRPCLAADTLASLAGTMDDFRLRFAEYRSEERGRREAGQRSRDIAGQRFKKVVRERLKWWREFEAGLLEYEVKAERLSRPGPDPGAARSGAVGKLTELLQLIEDTKSYWNGPPVRARNRQVRADWHLTAQHLNQLIGPIWRLAGLTVSYGPKTRYAKFLAFAVCRIEGREDISGENVKAAFRPPAVKKRSETES